MKQTQIRIIVSLTTAFLLSAVASAGVYTWKDGQGRVHFGDRPPQQAAVEEVEIRVNTYAAPSTILDNQDAGLSPDKVIIYTTQRCGYCRHAKTFMNTNKIPFKEYDVETSKKGKRDFKKLNGKGVPIILVGKKRLNGYRQSSLSAMLRGAGYEV